MCVNWINNGCYICYCIRLQMYKLNPTQIYFNQFLNNINEIKLEWNLSSNWIHSSMQLRFLFTCTFKTKRQGF